MAETLTPKLGLSKQDVGDTGWGPRTNAGFDSADSRFQTSSAASPVGVQQGFYVGQIHWETGVSPPILWVCTVVGTPGTFVRLSQIPGGGVVEAALILNNAIALRAKEVGGTARNVALMNASDDIEVGDAASDLVLRTLAGLTVRIAAGAPVNIWHETNLPKSGLLTYDTTIPLYFESAETAVVFATAISVAHGLVTVPRAVDVRLRCKTAEAGYSVNDEVVVRTDISQDYGGNRISQWVNATNIGISSSAGYAVLNRAGGAGAFGGTIITPANWRFIFRAWK